jgi:DNA-binding helix-hairpin-helix protein with protein kinase domain
MPDDNSALIIAVPRADKAWENVSVPADELKPIGRGAVAKVYAYSAADGSTYALKIFNKPAAAPWDKLEFLQQKFGGHPAASLPKKKAWSVGWPISLIRRGNALANNAGTLLVPVGILLRYLDPGWRTLDHWIENHLLRKLDDQRQSLSWRLLILRNCAAALAELHAKSIAVIDVKPANIFVRLSSGHICLTDADGYRIGTKFPATHFSANYIIPMALDSMDVARLDETQDCYALAVIVFQVLNYGIHPFQFKSATQYDTTNDGNAKNYRYAYGPKQPWLAIEPLPQSVHNCWPSELRDMLSGAFTKDGALPRARDWEHYFTSLLDNKRLVPCRNEPKDPRHIHFPDHPCMACTRQREVEKINKANERKRKLAPKPRPAPPPRPTPAPQPRPTPTPNASSGRVVIFWIILIAVIAMIFHSITRH